MNRYLRPARLGEALEVLAGDPDAVPVGGGIVVLQEAQASPGRDRRYVDVTHIDDLLRIEERDDGVEIGAAVTLWEVLRSPVVAGSAPLLAEACSHVSAPAIRNQATVGGNLAAAAPTHDPIPTLAALSARIRIRSAHGERTCSIEELVAGPGRNTLEPGELIVSVHVPGPGPGWGYRTFPGLGMQDRSIANAAVLLRTDGGDAVRQASVVVGAVTPRPLRLRSVEDLLTGSALSAIPGEITDAAAEDVSEVEVLDDHRGEAWYRRRLAAVLARRAVHDAVARCR